MFLEVMASLGDIEEARKKIGECLQVVWNALPNSLFESLIGYLLKIWFFDLFYHIRP
jgi:hypothetical protein